MKLNCPRGKKIMTDHEKDRISSLPIKLKPLLTQFPSISKSYTEKLLDYQAKIKNKVEMWALWIEIYSRRNMQHLHKAPICESNIYVT